MLILKWVSIYWIVMMVGSFCYQVYQDYIRKMPDSKFGTLFGNCWYVHFMGIALSGIIIPWLYWPELKSYLTKKD